MTATDIKNMDFGYLTGLDIVKYCPVQFLITQETIDTGFIENSVSTAYSEIRSKLVGRYALDNELTKTGNQRYYLLVKLLALTAVRNIVSNLSGIPEHMATNFKWLDYTILDIRNGQIALDLVEIQIEGRASNIEIVKSEFLTLG